MKKKTGNQNEVTKRKTTPPSTTKLTPFTGVQQKSREFVGREECGGRKKERKQALAYVSASRTNTFMR